MPVKPILIALSLLVLLPTELRGNDGAAEIALGGIRLKQERRVAMVKERLFISKKKVRVEYEFRNESNEAVTTEIAFPIPDYRWGILGWQPFDDFKVWASNQPAPFHIEARAFAKGQEITEVLKSLGVNIATLGDFEEGTGNPKANGKPGGKPATSQMERLKTADLDRLVAIGAVDGDTSDYRFRHVPLWTVEKTYHWTQTFPAGATVSIAHEYTPTAGDAGYMDIDGLVHPHTSGYNTTAEPGCPDESLRRSLTLAIQKRNMTDHIREGQLANTFCASWVRYILTTANTWQTPIRDFELVVERDPGEFITFCWDGPVEKTGANTFRARAKDFIPSKELTVYFLQP